MAAEKSKMGGADADLPFRQVAQDLPTPCWISDAAGSIIWVNAAWIAYTGMDVDAIRSEGLERLHDPDTFPVVRERWSGARERGERVEMVFPLRGTDGRLRPFQTRVVPLRDHRGIVTRWFGTNTDISAQSAAETLLRESQARLELATEAAQLGVWDWDLVSGRFVYSARAREICGFSTEEDITYDKVVAVTHPDDYPRTSAMARDAVDPEVKATEPYKYRLLRSDGSMRWVEAHGRAVFEGGRAIRYVGTLEDITETVRLEQSVRDNEALLRGIFDASELFIAVIELTDDGFRYIMANKATLAFYRLPPEAANFSARDVGVPADEIAAWRQTMVDIWESGQTRTLEYSFDGGSGRGWYIGTYSPLNSGQDAPRRLAFVVIDVTARREAEERQNLLMREVDHRARNALAVAQAIVQLSQPDDPQRFKMSVRGRIASLARSHSILAEEGWKGADLRKLIDAELAPFQVQDRPRFRVEGPHFTFAPAAAQSMGLVIHELVINALKHGALADRDGGLVVTWTVDENGLHLTWRETGGPGISSALKPGFGFTIMDQTIKGQLKGEWRIQPAPGGVICLIDIPAPGRR